MLDVLSIRKDFPLLQNRDVIYLDNAATTLKPQQVIDAVTYYYTNLGANSHRGDYDLSHDVDVYYEKCSCKSCKIY